MQYQRRAYYLKIAFLYLALFCAGYGRAFAQYYFRHFKVEDGLSNNIVFSSAQDKHGFMWFGTRDGLNRFDGYSFKAFRNEGGNPRSLGSNRINHLYNDRHGTLWVCTFDGLYRFNDNTEDFMLLNITAGASVGSVLLDNEDNLWIISAPNLYKYNLKTRKSKTYKSLRTTTMCITGGTLWLGTNDGFLRKYQPATDDFASFDTFKNSTASGSHFIKTIHSTSQNSILVGTSNQGVKLFDIATQTCRDLLTYNPDKTGIYVRNFLQTGESEYWIATETGIFIYDLKTGSVTNLKKQLDNPYSISDNAVYTLYKDKEGGIWAGSYFGGINYYPKPYRIFEKYFPRTTGNSISGNAIREITADKNQNIWIGTEDAGLNKLDPRTGRFTHFTTQGTKTTIAYSNIHGLLATGDKLWVGTFEHGLDVLNINTGEVIRHYAIDPKAFSARKNFVITLYQTSTGEILMGTGMGLYRYNSTIDEFEKVRNVKTNDFVFSILEDREGTIWLGTLGRGVYYYNAATGKSGHLFYDPKSGNNLTSNAVSSIFQDHAGRLWFATEGNGLCLLDKNTGNVKSYTTKDGLPSNIVFRILEDDNHHLWMSTSKGLVNFDPAKQTFEVFTKTNGLLTDQFNYNSGFKDASGKMYFGSINGMISFDPLEFVPNKFVAPVYITGFQVFNKELTINSENSPLKQSIINTRSLELDYDRSTFSIDFSSLSYTAPEVNSYAYKMVGLDKDWTYLKSNRKVYFTDLPSGNYTFLIKASNSSGVWNSKPARLDIVIRHPFWAGPLAYTVYIVALIALIYLMVRRYTRRISDKNRRQIELVEIGKQREIEHLEAEKEKEIYNAKIDFFTSVTHEIRTPLTLISGPLERIMEHEHPQPEVRMNLRIMERNTRHLLDLMNQLLDFRKAETLGFNLFFIKTDIPAALNETFLRFKAAAEHKRLKYEMVIPDGMVFAFVDLAAMHKILSNLFSNAIKYSGKKVLIKLQPVKQFDTMFCLEIQNDGPLVPEQMQEKIFEPFYRLEESSSQLGTGVGLPLARSLTELHQGTLNFSTVGGMNTFVLSLPLYQDAAISFEPTIVPDDEYLDFEEPTGRTATGANKPLILIVDDSKDILGFLVKDLESDYAVITAKDGNQAFGLLADNAVQLVVSDVRMPVMGGFELCEKIKSTVEFSHIPVILLTSKNGLEAKIEGLELGADCYIEKPFSPHHLSVQIQNLLVNRSKVKDHFLHDPFSGIKTIASNKTDEAFLEQLNQAISAHMADANLDVNALAGYMNMSRPTLFRKIKAVSSLSPKEMINITRLKRAVELFSEKKYRIYEVCEIVGYGSQSYFSKSFTGYFGITPSEYLKKMRAGNEGVSI